MSYIRILTLLLIRASWSLIARLKTRARTFQSDPTQQVVLYLTLWKSYRSGRGRQGAPPSIVAICWRIVYKGEKLPFSNSWRGTCFTYCISTSRRESLHILKTWVKNTGESAKSQTSLDFTRRRKLFSNQRFFRPCRAVLSLAEHPFLDTLDWTTLDTYSCAGLHERRDCEVHAVLSAAAGIGPVIVVLPPDESGRVYEENFSLCRDSHL